MEIGVRSGMWFNGSFRTGGYVAFYSNDGSTVLEERIFSVKQYEETGLTCAQALFAAKRARDMFVIEQNKKVETRAK